MKDWRGGKAAVFKTLGASNHCDHEREVNDFYATEPAAVEWLCKLETFNHRVLEPSCGAGHISKVLLEHGYDVTSRDLVDRGFGEVQDFLGFWTQEWDGDIITNPPYSLALEFVEKALSIIPEGNKVAMFLKLTFLEGKRRKSFFEKCPPLRVWVSSSRLKCAMNGEFDAVGGSAACYAWFVWQKGYKGETILRWFN